MYPDIVSIGSLTIHTYGLFVALGFAAAVFLSAWLGKSDGLPLNLILDIAFVGIVWAIVGSRLFYILLNLEHFRLHPLDAFKIWQGGLVFSGGLVAAALALILYLKKRRVAILPTADIVAPGLALGQGIGRIGCLFAGCCYGRPSDLPWTVVFRHPDSLAPLYVSLHPTQVYAAAGGIVLFIILLIILKRRLFPGQVFVWYMILHSTFRLIEERFRGDYRGLVPGTEMSVTQLLTLIVLVGSVISLYIIKSKDSKRTDT